jgi:hypothetical protein
MATIQTEDVLPVRSRVSWGAIFAGTATAFAVYIVLGALGVALGLTVGDRMEGDQIGMAAGIWTIVSLLLALFTGGFVASRFSVGENKTEAAMYGVILWGVVFASLLWLMTSGIRMGFTAIMGVANSPVTASVASRMTDKDLQDAGFTQEQIDAMRAQFNKLRDRAENLPQDARQAVNDPRVTEAAWWTFAGILLSMAAAVGGALLGSGPNLVLAAVRFRATGATIETPAREPANRR